MANTATNVAAGKPSIGGAISVAPLGTTPPTSVTATLTGFTTLGYVSEDGVVNSNSRSSTDVKAWGGDTVLSLQTEKTDTFQFTLLEALNTDVLKVYFGSDNVSGAVSTGITVNANANELTEQVWVIDMILRGVQKRIVIPSGKVTATEDITYSDSAAVGLGVTITAFPDSSGNSHYEYLKTKSTTT